MLLCKKFLLCFLHNLASPEDLYAALTRGRGRDRWMEIEMGSSGSFLQKAVSQIWNNTFCLISS